MLDFHFKEIKRKVFSRFTEWISKSTDLSISLLIYKIEIGSKSDFYKVIDLSIILIG